MQWNYNHWTSSQKKIFQCECKENEPSFYKGFLLLISKYYSGTYKDWKRSLNSQINWYFNVTLIPSTWFVQFLQDLKYQYENINLKVCFSGINIWSKNWFHLTIFYVIYLFFLVSITYKASKRTFECTFELDKSIFSTCLAGKWNKRQNR